MPGAEELLQHGIDGLAEAVSGVGDESRLELGRAGLRSDDHPGHLPVALGMVDDREEDAGRVGPLDAEDLTHAGLLTAGLMNFAEHPAHGGRHARGSVHPTVFDDASLRRREGRQRR
jgi:hypothetical protein